MVVVLRRLITERRASNALLATVRRRIRVAEGGFFRKHSVYVALGSRSYHGSSSGVSVASRRLCSTTST